MVQAQCKLQSYHISNNPQKRRNRRQGREGTAPQIVVIGVWPPNNLAS